MADVTRRSVMSDKPEEHEALDELIGDVACYSPGGTIDHFEMEPDLDGEWVKIADVEASFLRYFRDEIERLRAALDAVTTFHQVTHCHAAARAALAGMHVGATTPDRTAT